MRELVTHVGEEVRLGPAGLLQLRVQPLELLRRPALVFVELVKLSAHRVHPGGQGAELVAIRDVDARAEVTLGDVRQESLGLPDGQDERPGDDEPEQESEEDRGRREAPMSHRAFRLAAATWEPKPGHLRLFTLNDPGDEAGDLPVERLAFVEMERHRLVDLARPDERRHRPHRAQDLGMDLANPLDGFLLLRRGGPIEDGERIAEPVALPEDALDGRLVPEEHGIPDEVHLRAHGAGNLA